MNPARTGRRLFLLGLLAAAYASYAAGGSGSALPDGEPPWAPLFQGINMAQIAQPGPAPLRVYAVRIRLGCEGIRFLVTPDNGQKPAETDAARTSTFARKHGCQVAINGSPFSPVPNREGEPIDIVGLSLSRGDAYSEAHPRFGALVLTADNRARISAPPIDLTDARNGLGGFGLLLDEGRNLGEDAKRHPRTAVGLSQDGRMLILMVIDGRQPGRSIGATTRETAAWLAWFGAHNALNLDGGGSSVLVVADDNGQPRIVNTPVHGPLPGLERPVGNHLGVFAAPLPDGPRPLENPAGPR